jgi:hypothetical protein
MLDPFQVNKPVGMSYALDENDVLKTKNALSKLGHYKPLDSGSTPWPDTPMFEGLKAFQKEQGLKVDGLMKPGGPTEKALRKSTQPLGIMPGEWDWMNKTTKPKSPPRRPLDERPASKPEFPDPLRPLSLSGDPKTSPPQKSGSQPYSPPARPDETQVAAAPAAALLPWLLGSGAAVATGELMRRKAEEIIRNNGGNLPPLFPAEPEPPTPPSEYPDADLKPNREEFPAIPSRGAEKLENPSSMPSPAIEIIRPIDEHLKNWGIIVENRRGIGRTPDGVDLTKKALYDELKKSLNQNDISDLGGGRTPDKSWIPEPYFPNSSAKSGENNRKGSSYADGGFRIIIADSVNDFLFEHQTTLKDGHTGTALERRKADKLRKNAQGAYVIEVPKQMKNEPNKYYETRIRNIVKKNVSKIMLQLKERR